MDGVIKGDFCQSIKQSIAEGQLVDAEQRGDEKRVDNLKAKIDRYESEPSSGEGKKELLEKARSLEAARDEARMHSPWLTFSGMLFQLAIVLLSAAIIAVDMRMYWASWGVGALGLTLMLQGILLIV